MAQKKSYEPNGDYARLLREQLGWSQDELGERAVCGPRTIRNIEKGVAVSADSLKAVAEKLGLAHWHELLSDAEKARLQLTPSESEEADKPPTATPPEPPGPTPSPAPTAESDGPTNAILVLIDVVGYTPQAKAAGDAATQVFDKYLKDELKKRAKPHKVRWIKPIGDAALLWCRHPSSLVEFALELFLRDPIAPHAGFNPSFRMLAHMAFFRFSRRPTGSVKDVHGWRAIVLFRLEKAAHRNRVVVTEHLFGGLEHLLEPKRITHHAETQVEELKGVGAGSPRQIHILRPPVAEQNLDREFPGAYQKAREELQQDVQFIPVFGKLYPPIPMRENFLHLTLDQHRTRTQGHYARWDYPKLWRRMELDTDRSDRPKGPAASEIDHRRIPPDILYTLYPTAVIAGLPGAGKTTILRHFAWHSLEKNPYAAVVFVEAKYLHSGHFPEGTTFNLTHAFTVLATLFLHKGDDPKSFSPEARAIVDGLAEKLREAFVERRVVVLIDALDEAPTAAHRRQLATLANLLMESLVRGCSEGPPTTAGRCYLSLRAAEFDQHTFTTDYVLLVNPLDTEQIRAIARRQLGDQTPEYEKFDQEIWQRLDVQKIAGTPLTAMLMVFFYSVSGRFARRYDTYRLLVLFVLDRAWHRVKAGEFYHERQGLKPFFRDVEKPDFLANNPGLAKQLTALSAVSIRLLYEQDEKASQASVTERTVSRKEFRELLATTQQAIPATEFETWEEVWSRENLLLPAGKDTWAFLHSTILEFLAAEFVKDHLREPGAAALYPVFNDAGRDHLETLPIVCSTDHPLPAQVLARLSQRPGGFEFTATLPYRCLTELETSDRDHLAEFSTKSLLKKKESELAARPGVGWAYDHIYRWVVSPPGDDEPGKVKFLDNRIADLSGLMRLSRDVLARRVAAIWVSDRGSLARKQEELLQKMLAPDVWKAVPPPTQADAPTVEGHERYLGVLESVRGKSFAEHVQLALRKCGTSPESPLTLDLPGHPEDRNLAFHRMASTPSLLGFLGSPNFRMGGAVRCLTVSPDGRQALSGSDDNTLKLWDVASGKEVRAFSGHTGSINACKFSSDGRQVLSGSADKTLKLWDVATGNEDQAFKGHTGTVNACGFSPDGRQVLSGSADKTLKLWDVATGKEARAFKGHTSNVWACVFSPNGRLVLSGSWDNTLKLWDVATGDEVLTFNGHTDRVNACVFSPDGRQVLSGSEDKTLKLWDVVTGKQIQTIAGHHSYVNSCVFSPDGRQILSGTEDKTLNLWDVATGKGARALAGHTGPVKACVFSPDGRQVLSGSGDNTLKLWEVATGKEARTLAGHSGAVMACVFSPDGRQVLSGSGDNTLKLWDVTTGKEVRTLTGHFSYVYACVFSPDGRQVLSGSEDNTLKLWDVATGKEARMLTGHNSSVYACVFSPDGRHVLSGSEDDELKLWDVATGKGARAFKGHVGYVKACVFSPDGRQVLSGSGDNTLKLWDVATGKEARTLAGHSGPVMACVFSPDGRQVLSGSGDNTLKLWDEATGKQARAFNGHTGSVYACVFSPDGRQVLSGSNDKTLRLWDVATGKDLHLWAMPAAVRGISLDPKNPKRAVVALSSGVLALVDLANREPPFQEA